METLEESRMCRLCGKHSGIAIDIFDKAENHMRKINAILPILVHEMDLLPKQMCHRCSYKLEEFYNFYVDCAKTDTELKNQLSWMRKENLEEKIITPMVKINKFKIKTEPPDNNNAIINAIDTNNVLKHIDENSLLFPKSILQSNFDPSRTPALPCSRCRCICSKSIKIIKNSPKQVKVTTNIELETQMSSSNIISNITDKINKLNKSKCVDKTFNLNKEIFEENTLKKKNSKEIFILNHNNDCNESKSPCNENILKSEKLYRALRPRKSSIDYMDQKKKGIATNLKTKFKNKMNIFDSSLVKSVDIKLSQCNSIYLSPIIKLQKIDETLRVLKNRKKFEKFNKRIQKYKHNQNMQKEGNKKKNIFHRRENHNMEIFQQEDNQGKKSLYRKEIQNRRSLQREEMSNKKDLHNEENQNEQYSYSITRKTNENIKIMPLKIKQDIINKTSKNEFSEQLLQEKSFEINHLKGQKICKPIDRYPLCAVVKLEKDYTCNVDYPRIKFKKHFAMANPSKLENGPLQVPVSQNSIFKLSVNRKACIMSENNVSPKNLRSKKTVLKLSNNENKSEKKSIKNNKKLNIVKRILLKKTSSVISQTDLKCYCDECNSCFRNKELYKLHSCY